MGSKTPSACCPSFCFKRDGKQRCKTNANLSDRLYGIPPHSRENFPGNLTPARHAVREEQIALCHEVLDTLYNKEISLCEAGVGTGKTLAYLVGCILWQMNRPERMKLPIVISTSSVALQDAILTEYLPDLSAILLAEASSPHPSQPWSARAKSVCLRCPPCRKSIAGAAKQKTAEEQPAHCGKYSGHGSYPGTLPL